VNILCVNVVSLLDFRVLFLFNASKSQTIPLKNAAGGYAASLVLLYKFFFCIFSLFRGEFKSKMETEDDDDSRLSEGIRNLVKTTKLARIENEQLQLRYKVKVEQLELQNARLLDANRVLESELAVHSLSR